MTHSFEFVTPLITALAAFLGTLLLHFLRQKHESSEYLRTKKIECYSSFLDAFHDLVASNSEYNLQKVVACTRKIELLTRNDKLKNSLNLLYDPQHNEPEEQKKLISKIIELMNNDISL
jgi:hypothetical protein